METLVLSRAYIAGRVPPRAYLEAVQAAFLGLATGQVRVPPIGHIPAEGGAFHLKAAATAGEDARLVLKMNGNFPGNPSGHGLPTIQGFIALLDALRGSVLALLDSAEVTARRTAAASALAARLLARPDARVLGIVGCGVQARCHVDALRELFPLTRVACHDVDRARAEALARHVRASGFEATAVASIRDVAREADVLVTCTTSTRAVIGPGDVRPGCFIAAVGADNPLKQEIEPALLASARVVPDILAQAVVMGDLHHAVDAGAMTASDIHGELAELVAGRIAARTDEAQVFVFDSTGTAIEDLAAVEMLYRIACADPSAMRVELTG
jgi:ornithine cyclodeaminase/alanine dehydrogenase-like protein (mu-crystallin family)